jgi:hypothetical protein
MDKRKLIYGICPENHPARWLKVLARGIFEVNITPK